MPEAPSKISTTTAIEHREIRILKFRSFVSKEEEGFIVMVDHDVSEIIMEDLLFQLFEPIFGELPCPDVYYFSSTDQTLTYSEVLKMKDYVYVHFLQRVPQYSSTQKYTQKLRIGDLDRLSRGAYFQDSNLYVLSEKYYLLYGHPLFYDNITRKVEELPLKMQRKELKYDQYCNELISFKDNREFVKIKRELQLAMDDVGGRLAKLESMAHRYSCARNSLLNILEHSGIKIYGVKDLY